MSDWAGLPSIKPASWKQTFHRKIVAIEFVISEFRRLAITLLEFGSLLYVLYQVAKHL